MRLAIAGVGGLVSEALLEALGAAEERPETLVLLAESEDDELNPMYAGRSQPIKLFAEYDVTGVDAVIFVDEPDLAEAYLDGVLAAGVSVIDASGWSASLGMGDLVQAGMAGFTACDGAPRYWVCANPLSAVLADLFQALGQLTGVVSADVTACLPVSVVGRPGVDALASEAARLLNGQAVENKDIFPQQIAFNILPDAALGVSTELVQAELRHLLNSPELQLMLSAVVVPVFYGMTIALHVVCTEEIHLAELEGVLVSRGLTLAGEGEVISPVSHANEVGLTVSSLRQRSDNPHILSCWILADNIRKGAALNIMQLLEILKKSST